MTYVQVSNKACQENHAVSSGVCILLLTDCPCCTVQTDTIHFSLKLCCAFGLKRVHTFIAATSASVHTLIVTGVARTHRSSIHGWSYPKRDHRRPISVWKNRLTVSGNWGLIILSRQDTIRMTLPSLIVFHHNGSIHTT